MLSLFFLAASLVSRRLASALAPVVGGAGGADLKLFEATACGPGEETPVSCFTGAINNYVR